MKFSVNNAGFISAISPAILCSKNTEKKEHEDINKVCLIADKGNLFVLSNNGNMAIKADMTIDSKFKSEVDGIATVNSTDLMASVSSFKLDDTLTFELKGNELSIRPSSNARKLQSLPVESVKVEIPQLATDFGKKVAMKRQVFLDAAQKVVFAICTEKYRTEFLHWVMRVSPNKLRVVCGDGSRFAAYQIEGDNVVQAKDSIDIVIRDVHTKLLQSILKDCNTDDLILQEYIRKDNDSLMDQTVITAGNLLIVLIGHNPGIKWPDENKFLDRKNTIKVTIPMQEWEQEMKGLEATYNLDMKKISKKHITLMHFDLKNKMLTMSSENQMRAFRELAISDSVTDTPIDAFDVSFITPYLSDITPLIKDQSDILQFEFTNDIRQPVICKFYAGQKVTDGPIYKVNSANGTKEQYWFFSAPANDKKSK